MGLLVWQRMETSHIKLIGISRQKIIRTGRKQHKFQLFLFKKKILQLKDGK